MTRTLILSSLLSLVVASAHAGPPRYQKGELLVAVENPSALTLGPDGRVAGAASAVNGALERHALRRYSILRPASRTAGDRAPRFLRLISDRADFDPGAAARELRATGAFRAVVPNLSLELHATLPNDTYLNYQWYVNTMGNTDVQLPEAWDLWKGDTSTVIAVMDNGIDIGHPDLVSQVWKHPVEIANGVDDDGNGYIDDLKGWDFGDGDNDPSSQPVIDPATDIDIGFHGTFVAAIAAAATNNGTGIAGAGWNCRMMPLKVGNAAGDIPLSAVTEAFEYAADQGAEVLNMSLGTQDTTARAYFQALVDMATSANVLCVASAGNDGVSSMSFPAGCDNVLAVGATESNNTRADYSNWGPWVDVAAPGSLMWSAICRNYVVDDWSQIFYIFLWSWDGENPYMYNDGTSFSSPLTAGVCGLVRSKMPSLTPQQVIQHIVNTGDVVAYDHPIGPRLNAFRALNEQVLGVGPIEPVALMFERPSPNPFSTTTTIAFTLAEGGPARLRLYDCSGRMVRELASGNLPPGRHRLTWDGTGMDGRRQRSGVYFAQLESGGRTATKRVALTR